MPLPLDEKLVRDTWNEQHGVLSWWKFKTAPPLRLLPRTQLAREIKKIDQFVPKAATVSYVEYRAVRTYNWEDLEIRWQILGSIPGTDVKDILVDQVFERIRR